MYDSEHKTHAPKPCRSPYCECTPHQCSHPGYYDARHEPYEHPKTMNTIKPTHQIAYDYCQALLIQRACDERLDTALRCINSDNQIFGLADAVEGPYTNLVQTLLTPELFDWLMWWMYETNHGTQNMGFSIDGKEYDPTTMTLYKFLETVDAS